MPTNADYTREYFQIVDELDGAVEDRQIGRASCRERVSA